MTFQVLYLCHHLLTTLQSLISFFTEIDDFTLQLSYANDNCFFWSLSQCSIIALAFSLIKPSSKNHENCLTHIISNNNKMTTRPFIPFQASVLYHIETSLLFSRNETPSWQGQHSNQGFAIRKLRIIFRLSRIVFWKYIKNREHFFLLLTYKI